jgi:protein-S-isoprenylcysteine O-methyltransferase Ste14
MWCVVTAAVILLASYAAYAEVMRENAYLSRAIGVEQNQKVIDTGLYGVIRHPMYTSTLLMFVSIPIVLGSWLSLVCFAFYPIIIVIRIFDEEKLLKTELKGYVEYTQKVKYRLIPFIW